MKIADKLKLQLQGAVVLLNAMTEPRHQIERLPMKIETLEEALKYVRDCIKEIDENF